MTITPTDKDSWGINLHNVIQINSFNEKFMLLSFFITYNIKLKQQGTKGGFIKGG